MEILSTFHGGTMLDNSFLTLLFQAHYNTTPSPSIPFPQKYNWCKGSKRFWMVLVFTEGERALHELCRGKGVMGDGSEEIKYKYFPL